MRSSSSSSLLLLLLEKEQEAATAVARRRRNAEHPNYETMTTMTTEREHQLDGNEEFHDEGINENNTNEDTTHESDAAEDDDATTSTTIPQLQPHPPSQCSTYAATCLIILFWYGVSNATILVTKWLFTTSFPYPLTVTCYSNSLATVWAIVVRIQPHSSSQLLRQQLICSQPWKIQNSIVWNINFSSTYPSSPPTSTHSSSSSSSSSS